MTVILDLKVKHRSNYSKYSNNKFVNFIITWWRNHKLCIPVQQTIEKTTFRSYFGDRFVICKFEGVGGHIIKYVLWQAWNHHTQILWKQVDDKFYKKKIVLSPSVWFRCVTSHYVPPLICSYANSFSTCYVNTHREPCRYPSK